MSLSRLTLYTLSSGAQANIPANPRRKTLILSATNAAGAAGSQILITDRGGGTSLVTSALISLAIPISMMPLEMDYDTWGDFMRRPLWVTIALSGTLAVLDVEED